MRAVRFVAGAALCAALLLGCCGCGIFDFPTASPVPTPASPTPTSAQQSGNVGDAIFSINYDSAAGLEPLSGLTRTNSLAASLMYEGLFALDPDFKPERVLCSGYERSEDGLTWLFHIRGGVTFHDGTALTAYDAEYSLLRAREGDYAARYDLVEDFSARDAETLSVTLSAENALLPALLDIPVIKSGSADEKIPAGTGPYMFVDSGEYCFLKAYDGWHGDAQTLPLGRIYLKEYGAEALTGAFESGYVDLVRFDGASGNELYYGGNYETCWYDTSYLQYLGFSESGCFAEAAARLAVSAALDREYISTTALGGCGTPALLPTLRDFNGRAELESELAGKTVGSYSGKVVFLANTDNAVRLAAARAAADTLTELGYEVEFRALGWEEYVTALKNEDFDVYYAEVKLRGDFCLDAILGARGALDYADAGGGEYDALASQYRKTGGAQQALALYRSIAEQAHIVPVAFRRQAALIGRGTVTGLDPAQGSLFYGITDWTVTLGN